MQNYKNYITATVSLADFEANIRSVRRRIGDQCKLCVVLKADAYGHGIAGLWPSAARCADYIAVATIAEALKLRDMGYTGKLMTTMSCGTSAGEFLADLLSAAIEADIELAVSDSRAAGEISQLVTERILQPATVHLKIDTGMGRSGTPVANAREFLHGAVADKNLTVRGIFTHYANADGEDKTHAMSQTSSFTNLLDSAIAELPQFSQNIIRHAAASAAIAEFSAAHFDMVRLGLAAYGYQSGGLENPLDVKPILKLTAPITQTKQLPARSTCGYGCTRELTRDSRVAIVPAGYADGINRLLSNKLAVQVDNIFHAPILGRVSMDQIIIDITDIPTAKPGSEVTLISNNIGDDNSVTNLARQCDTIPYEITTSLNPHRTDFVYEQ